MTQSGFEKHEELITAWSKGAIIEYKGKFGNWYRTSEPKWNEAIEYRIVQFQPKPYERVLVLDREFKWHEKTFAGWDGPYPLTIVENSNDIPSAGNIYIEVEDWEAVKPLNN